MLSGMRGTELSRKRHRYKGTRLKGDTFCQSMSAFLVYCVRRSV